MFTVKENKNTVLEIRKSKFITFCFKLDEFDDIEKYLSIIKSNYKDASHCCYAYKIDTFEKFNGDKEPGGSGDAILDVINKANLTNVLIVIIRYFGGTKLGAGNLIRTYSNASSSVILDNIVELEDGFLIEINTSYDKQNILDYYIDNNSIIKKDYTNRILLTIKCNNLMLNVLKDNNIDYKIIKNILIEKE